MRRLAVAVLVGLAASAAPALARPLADSTTCTTFTDGAGTEHWSDGGNWSTGAPPAAGADVCIDFPIVFVDTAAQIRSLDAGNAALLVTADLAVGAGGATVSALDIGSGGVSVAGPLTAGTVNLHGGALGGPGRIDLLHWSGGTLDGSATVGRRADLAGDLKGGGALQIAPAASAHVARDTTVAVPLRNDGQLVVDGGVLTLTGGSDPGSGSYQVAAEATLDWHAGTYALSSPSVTGPGVVQLSGAARLDVTGAARVDASLAIAGGTLALSGSASLDVTGALANSGTVRLGNAALTAGTYTQAAGAILAEPLGGGVLSVRGAAALDGTLAFDRSDAVPDDGAVLPVIRYGSLSGGWATVAVAPLAGFSFRVAYAQDGAALTVHRDPLPIPPPPPPPPPAPEPTPVPGVRSVAVADRGTVLVQQPAGPQPGVAATFEPLKGTTSLPVGSVIDARNGQVTLTTASSFTDPGRPPTTLTVAAAIFQIRQTRARDGRTAVTDLILKTPPGRGRACLPPHKGVVRTLQRARARVSHRTIRRLRVTAKGVVRAFGKVAVLSTRDATFELRDRCDGTSAHVSQGRANLFDRIHGRTARLRARQTAIVRARLFAARRLHLKKVPRPKR